MASGHLRRRAVVSPSRGPPKAMITIEEQLVILRVVYAMDAVLANRAGLLMTLPDKTPLRACRDVSLSVLLTSSSAARRARTCMTASAELTATAALSRGPPARMTNLLKLGVAARSARSRRPSGAVSAPT